MEPQLLRRAYPQLGLKDHDGIFGIEIETETESYSSYDGDLVEVGEDDHGPVYSHPTVPSWKIVTDGSLRNFGLEYVFKKPLTYHGTLVALEEFENLARAVEFLDEPAAGSVHVHMDVSKLTTREFANLLVLWVLFENVYVGYCSDFRQANLFALPCRVAEVTVKNIARMFRDMPNSPGALNHNMDYTKYAAVNLSAIARFGSLEFRCLQGTTCTETIRTWIEALYTLRHEAQKYTDPTEIIDRYHADPEYFDATLFGCMADVLHVRGVDIRLATRKNLWYAASLADLYSDWSEIDVDWSSKPKARKAKPSAYNDMSYEQALDTMQSLMVNPSVASGIPPVSDEPPQSVPYQTISFDELVSLDNDPL